MTTEPDVVASYYEARSSAVESRIRLHVPPGTRVGDVMVVDAREGWISGRTRMLTAGWSPGVFGQFVRVAEPSDLGADVTVDSVALNRMVRLYVYSPRPPVPDPSHVDRRTFDLRHDGPHRFSWEPVSPRPTWEQYALLLAWAAASRSEDPVHKVGAVILRPDHSVAGLGYNGAPSGVDIDFTDTEGRKPLVIHAETNALRYTRPDDLGPGSLLATTRHPCPNCLTQIAAYGIRTLIVGERYPTDPAIQYIDDRDWRTLDRIVIELRLERVWLG